MDRYKKEMLKKYKAAREGLTPEEIEALNKKEEEERLAQEMVNKLHHELFPEEYDFMYDDHVACSDRDKGINPMNNSYILKVNQRRQSMGIAPLGENGMPDANSKSWQYCVDLVKNGHNKNS